MEPVCLQVGFRQVVIEGRQLLVNRQPILVKGVNRHEHDERRGKAVTEEGMLRDIQLLKQLNFNAVRCSHYPNTTRWWAYRSRLALVSRTALTRARADLCMADLPCHM